MPNQILIISHPLSATGIPDPYLLGRHVGSLVTAAVSDLFLTPWRAGVRGDSLVKSRGTNLNILLWLLDPSQSVASATKYLPF